MNILIVKLSAIGDVIHTLPALNAIRAHYPDAHITWVVEEAAADLVRGHRALNRVLVSGRKRWIKALKTPSRWLALREILTFFQELRDTRYDVVLDFQALLKSAMLIALVRGKRKIGFDKGMQHMEHSYVFLNERIGPVDMEVHALLRNMMMLKSIGINSGTVAYDLPIQPEHRIAAENLIYGDCREASKPVVAVNPVAKWDTKLWSNRSFARMADILVDQYEAHVVFTGSADDHDTIGQIRSMMTHRAVNLAGRTSLMELAAVYEKADVVVSTDTGPMHLAAAAGTPVVALFGPTAPWRTGPYGDGHRVLRADVSCSPCFRRLCPSMQCMKCIGVRQVVGAVAQLLNPDGVKP
ncbi:MAG: lipopolysaccharide heptosyltransferase I [Desulfobacterales bacterium]|nr:lipopolysaccharide heptosyltransferase I [Desulfobacterales bacterium]MDD4071187.1 lipopolysaccharide heptosyltransferase I [Desulfobacterales bacterium]MDD4392195.1 lipopolysaccharide heptosyltransferase I [Desulfobacterales bacterium]